MRGLKGFRDEPASRIKSNNDERTFPFQSSMYNRRTSARRTLHLVLEFFTILTRRQADQIRIFNFDPWAKFSLRCPVNEAQAYL